MATSREARKSATESMYR